MPKKGERLPYRVVYRYPGQPESRRAERTLDDAELEGGRMGQYGATVRVFHEREEDPLARFGPYEAHRYLLRRAGDPESDLLCQCGRTPRDDSEARSHLSRAGRCWVCEGTCLVAEKVTRDGRPTPGDLVPCPVCQGSGRDADVSYWDVDLSLFYDRATALRLKAASRS